MDCTDVVTRFAINKGYDGVEYVGKINDVEYYKTIKKARTNGGYIGSPSIIGWTKEGKAYIVDDFSDERYFDEII